MNRWFKSTLSRRSFFGTALAAAAGPRVLSAMGHGDHMSTTGEVDNARNGFDPHAVLTDWDTGRVSQQSDGRRVRNFNVAAIEHQIEVAPNLLFPAWTYNGRVPGPTLRATEGDIVRITFKNLSTHKHNMHFHGIHSPAMDGLPGIGEVAPGDQFIYEFSARPFGCHLYHCHAHPLR
ncbi:MAG: multicopper oxidase domain-containing protein, partial [Gammaproteobacteria bacterium]